jgi:hypothetical protein
LTLAVGFTALVNVLAAATLVWTQWLTANVRWTAAATLAVVWLLAWLEGRADWRRFLAERSTGDGEVNSPVMRSDRWFCEAQGAYLAGDWVSAEQTLLKLLKHDSRDIEARLMLATLWRHEGRHEAAIEELDRLERLEASRGWKSEITWERERIGPASVEEEPQILKLKASEEPPEQLSRLAA